MFSTFINIGAAFVVSLFVAFTLFAGLVGSCVGIAYKLFM